MHSHNYYVFQGKYIVKIPQIQHSKDLIFEDHTILKIITCAEGSTFMPYSLMPAKQ